MDETQDAFDLALARWAIQDKIPLLAICRGNQVVNVALGGTLVQDMTEEMGATTTATLCTTSNWTPTRAAARRRCR